MRTTQSRRLRRLLAAVTSVVVPALWLATPAEALGPQHDTLSGDGDGDTINACDAGRDDVDGGAGANDHAKVNRGVDHVQGVEHVTSCRAGGRPAPSREPCLTSSQAVHCEFERQDHDPTTVRPVQFHETEFERS